MCLQVHIHLCAHACWGKKLALGDFLHLSISLILVDEGKVSLWTLSFPVPLNSVAILLWKPLSLVLELWDCRGIFRPVGHALVRGPDLPGSWLHGSHFTPVPQLPTQPNIAFPFEDLFLFMCQDVSAYFCHVYESAWEARRGHQIPKSWSYPWLWATQCRCWEPNPGPLQE